MKRPEKKDIQRYCKQFGFQHKVTEEGRAFNRGYDELEKFLPSEEDVIRIGNHLYYDGIKNYSNSMLKAYQNGINKTVNAINKRLRGEL